MWRSYVYLHRKATSGEPFYVGKGTRSDRAGSRQRRSAAWLNVADKHGVTIEVVAHCIDDTEAQRLERELIAAFGRRDLGLGPLVNMTDGGDGHAGIVASEALRQKRSLNSRGKRSAAWVAAIREARRGGGNGGVVKAGDTLPASWREAIAAAKCGERNPQFGRATPISKKVRNTKTGAVYDSIARAAKAEGLSAPALYHYLAGSRPNPTTLARV